MEDKLRAHMDYLFREVPQTHKAVEIKEEILQNLVDKYHDLIKEGKTPEAAYNIAVASVGDLSDLLASLKEPGKSSEELNVLEYQQWKKRSAIMVPIAVMLYIISVIPPILISEFFGNDELGAALMFLFIAAATGILIYNSMSKPTYVKQDDTIMEDFKEWKNSQAAEKQALKSIKSALWSIIVVLYLIISFTTGAWGITWIIFLLGGALESVIRAIFDLKKR